MPPRLLCFVCLCLFFRATVSTAGDPWDPNRKFCGRLLIVIVGAGEMHERNDSNRPEITASYGYADFEQFRRNDPGGAPSFSIVVTSARELVAKLHELPKAIKEESGFLGVVPASIDSINDLLSDDPNVSLIKRATTNFSECDACQKLMKSEHCPSVLPLLKTEIVIESQNSNNGVPLWSKKDQTGDFYKEWVEQENLPTLKGDLIARLRSKMGDGLFQTFVESCEGSRIGEYYNTADQCSCFLSLTDQNALIFIGGAQSCGFTASMTTQSNRKAPTKTYSGAESIIAMGPKMLSKFATYAAGTPDDSGGTSIFAVGKHANPLHSFVYTSADARVEKVLRKFEEQGVGGELPRLLLEAGFTEQLTSFQETAVANRSDWLLQRVLSAAAAIRNSYMPYMRDVTESPGEFQFAHYMDRFRACAKHTNPRPEVCGSLSQLISIAERGTAEGGNQTDADEAILIERDKFLNMFDEGNTSSLVAKYRKRELSLIQLFEKLNSLSEEFEKFRKLLTSYGNEYYKKKPPPSLVDGLKEMRQDFRGALFAVQEQFFPILRKEALAVRLLRIEGAAKLLATQGSEIKDLDAKEELRQLGNDLVCLTAFPVGPAFDAQYGKK
jgi:hypothetical protein